MKKISISMFALLAIIVAISSAFTTASKKTTDLYKIFGVNHSPAILESNTPSPSTLLGQKDGEFYYEDESDPGSIDTYESTHSSTLDCSTTTDVVCLAKIFVPGSGSASVIDLTNGEFTDLR